ncbi:unnamed protein product [Cuscuta campestris]|uniref:Myb/SANT-like domain-containing protein n=1 Tax=Cuscuta campestris TaxID=132261 RepID=A0A484MG50_9ASTE|nr:unnamed protein product [Cuscuta campestris]
MKSADEPNFKVKTQKKIIVACSILHNYLLRGDPDEAWDEDTDEDEDDNLDGNENTIPHARSGNENTRMAEELRDSIAKAIMATKTNRAGVRTTTWTEDMDEFLIDAHLEQHRKGNRVGGTFTPRAYDYILKELKEKYPDENWTKDKFRGHMRLLKGKFSAAFDVFRHISTSGWGFNSTTMTWDVDDDVWDAFVEAHPEAKEWRDKPIPFYDKMCELYARDRATGEFAETPSEMRQSREGGSDAFTGIQSDCGIINDIDDLLSNNECTLEASPTPLVGNTKQVGGDDAPKSSENMSKDKTRKKKKIKLSDEEFLTKSVTLISDAMKTCTSEYLKEKNPLPPADIWNLVGSLSFEGSRKSHAYMFLLEKPVTVKAILGLPEEVRESFLNDVLNKEGI